LKNILISIETLTYGGAEIFAVNLAKAISTHCSNVVLYILYPDRVEENLIKDLPQNVIVKTPNIYFDFLVTKIDSLFYRLFIDFSFRNLLLRSDIHKTLKKYSIGIIHTHLFKTDYLFYTALVEYNNKYNHISTVHGDYFSFYKKAASGEKIYKLLNYRKKLKKLLRSDVQFVCISEKQISFFKDLYPGIKCIKIHNGYAPRPVSSPQNRATLGIKKNDFVFGMVGRGIKEKGWEIAIKAFKNISSNDRHLILVGDSEYLRDCKKKFKAKNIHFLGFSDNPLQWISIFNVGLHPSYYSSESYPTVILEYIYCSIPIIASDIGETRRILYNWGKPIGVLVECSSINEGINQFSESMKTYIGKKNLLVEHKKNVSNAFEKHSMKDCVSRYLDFYNKVGIS